MRLGAVGLAILFARGLPTPDASDLVEQGRAQRRGGRPPRCARGRPGGLVRNQVAAIVGILVLGFALEPLLLGLAPEVGRYGPFIALPTSVQGLSEEDLGENAADLLPAGLALLGMLAWIAAASAAAAALLRRRDLN